jgi:hypothetical protein
VRIITSQLNVSASGEVVACEGKLWRLRPTTDGTYTADDLREMTMPAGISGISKRPSWRNYNIGQRSRLVGTAAWTGNVLVDELMRSLRQGIPAPFTIPTVAAAAGPGPSGAAICSIRFLDSRGGRVSPRGASAPSVTLANQSRAWSNLPTTCVDSSVDSIQGLVSMDGAIDRVAWTRQLGVTAVTENVATLALGEADPGSFTDLPLGSMNEVYHERQVVAGNDRYPQRAHFSALGELERYEGLSVDTDGEAIQGMFVQNDLLMLGSFQRIYRVAGYTADDLTREIEKPDVGLIGHHAIVNMHKRSIVGTTVGFQMYDGQWHYLMDDRRTEWEREYALYRSYYERAQAFWNPRRNVFMFGPVPHSQITGNVHWTLDAKRLTPEIEADEYAVCWANDARSREDTTRATFFLPGSAQPQVAVGSTYGMLLDDHADSDDDADGLLREMDVRPATLMPDPGGGIRDANRFQRAWTYVTCEGVSDYALEFRTGQEGCADNPVPALQFIIFEPGGSYAGQAEPTTSRAHLLKSCAGEAISVRIKVPGNTTIPPDRSQVVFRGYGLTISPGVKARLLTGQGPPG